MSISEATHFDDPNGDLILRSSDEVDFRVSKNILRMASPFFRDLLSLPQPSAEPQCSANSKDGLPIISASEESATLDAVLRFCHPVKSPNLPDLESIEKVLAAALKYDMEVVVENACRLLLSPCGIVENPVRVYAIACRYKLKEEARLAAKSSLSVDISKMYATELEFISGGDLFRLTEYRQRVIQLVLPLFQISDCQPYYLLSRCGNTVSCRSCCGSSFSRGSIRQIGVSAWWQGFASRARTIVRLAPTSDTIFSSMSASEALGDGASCSECRSDMHGKYHTAKDIVKDEIERLVSGVSYFPFHSYSNSFSEFIQQVEIKLYGF